MSFQSLLILEHISSFSFINYYLWILMRNLKELMSNLENLIQKWHLFFVLSWNFYERFYFYFCSLLMLYIIKFGFSIYLRTLKLYIQLHVLFHLILLILCMSNLNLIFQSIKSFSLSIASVLNLSIILLNKEFHQLRYKEGHSLHMEFVNVHHIILKNNCMSNQRHLYILNHIYGHRNIHIQN